jgi:hypothetical protein
MRGGRNQGPIAYAQDTRSAKIKLMAREEAYARF